MRRLSQSIGLCLRPAAAAFNHARQFGESIIHVNELDGEHHYERVEPDFRAPAPADVKGGHVEP